MKNCFTDFAHIYVKTRKITEPLAHGI